MLLFCTLQVNKMVGVIESYSKLEVLEVVRFLQAKGVSENRCRSANVYGQNIFSERKRLCHFSADSGLGVASSAASTTYSTSSAIRFLPFLTF
jgi:hypothetical protein